MTPKRKIRQLTIGTHDFPTLMEKPESKYVDKTDLLYQLATDNETQFFISRPRRFGKSLMLSTLQAMFEGRRDLFKGLKIDEKDWEGWTTPVPVLHFDMAKLAPSEGIPAMKETLRLLIDEKAEEAGCDKPSTELLGFAFEELLSSVAQKSPTGKVVVLIDEYDSPVQGFLDNPAELKEVNAFLHDFYRRLKNNAAIIRFLMITGVTKLTKLSVFSGLNHLIDLSMSPRFATLLGYTPQELDGPLRENVEAFGKTNGLDFKDAKKALLDWYDGYRFSP
ncbi:MAG: AAA family ATPase, partial [Kiritimatiellae bacterium]|nr:AAA family ATPase [Kiritimatiellia bacterium]